MVAKARAAQEAALPLAEREFRRMEEQLRLFKAMNEEESARRAAR